MYKKLVCVVLLLAFLPLAGCVAGKAWYYPYGPSYFGEDPRPQSIEQYLSQPSPK